MQEVQIGKYLKKFNVSQDFSENPVKFRSCPGCLEDFNSETCPLLLKCGHFICASCKDDEYYASHCVVCNTQIQVLDAHFDKLILIDRFGLQYVKQHQGDLGNSTGNVQGSSVNQQPILASKFKSERTQKGSKIQINLQDAVKYKYNYHVQSTDNPRNNEVIKEAEGYFTYSKLVEKSNYLSAYAQKYRDKGLVIMINGVSRFYKDYRDVIIAQDIGNMKPSQTGKLNTVLVYARNIGGLKITDF